jgi:hypothetical protein
MPQARLLFKNPRGAHLEIVRPLAEASFALSRFCLLLFPSSWNIHCGPAYLSLICSICSLYIRCGPVYLSLIYFSADSSAAASAYSLPLPVSGPGRDPSAIPDDVRAQLGSDMMVGWFMTIVADETHFVSSLNCGFAFLASEGVVHMRCFVFSLTILHWDSQATKERRVHFHIWYNLRRIFLPGQNFNLRSLSTSLSYVTTFFFVKLWKITHTESRVLASLPMPRVGNFPFT